jgi:hypothetical protein
MTTATKIAKNSPYALFETDTTVEQNGLQLDYGPFYFTVARAGGANNRFRDVLRQRMAPHKRAMATDTMSDDLQDKIGMEVFCETVILGWGSEEFGEGKIPGRDGKAVDFSVEAVKKIFKDLPDLARDVFTQAQSVALFRSAIAEIDSKN